MSLANHYQGRLVNQATRHSRISRTGTTVAAVGSEQRRCCQCSQLSRNDSNNPRVVEATGDASQVRDGESSDPAVVTAEPVRRRKPLRDGERCDKPLLIDRLMRRLLGRSKGTSL